MAQANPDQKQLIYYADPMCSWCWGFSPVITALAARFAGDAPIQLIMGGLRPGTTKVMADKDKAYIRSHWEHVQERTGQSFNFDFFERTDFVYDTEPACRAVATARSFGPAHGLSMLARVHRAFYMEGQDTTDRETLIGLAAADGIDPQVFAEQFDSKDAKRVTQLDFQFAQETGVSGFPTLLAGTDRKGFGLVTSGYQPLEALEGPIAQWLSG